MNIVAKVSTKISSANECEREEKPQIGIHAIASGKGQKKQDVPAALVNPWSREASAERLRKTARLVLSGNFFGRDTSRESVKNPRIVAKQLPMPC